MTITVTVDRPLGSCHPNHKNLIYPINYGYIKGIIANDGEEQDAYILGVNKPVKEFTGKLIAVVKRFNDNEDKWVIAPKNTNFTIKEIKESVNFQEQYFDTEIKPVTDIHWLFFDIGSTLINEKSCIKEKIKEITVKNNIDKNEFTNLVLNLSKTSFNAVNDAADFYNAEIPKWHSELEYPYKNAFEILNILSKSYHLGIIANQPSGTRERLNNWGMDKYFELIVSSDEEGISKPDINIFKSAIRKSGCNPEQAVMIGDRIDNDILPARKLGMKTVWIRQGLSKLYQKEQGLEFDISVNSLDELLKALILIEIQ